MKTLFSTSLIVSVLAFLITGCSSPAERMAEKGIPPMTAEQIKTTVSNNSLYERGRDWEWAGYYRADGTMTGRAWWNGGEEKASGIWEVTDDDHFCSDWDNQWGGGDYSCYQVFKDGDKLIWQHVSGSRGNSENDWSDLLQGNPYGF